MKIRGSVLSPSATALDERAVVVLVREDRAVAEAARRVRVVAADLHVHARRPAKIERRVRRPEDLVVVRRHAPAPLLALDQTEREASPAEDVGVERIGPKAPCEVLRGDAGSAREELPGAELAADLEEVRRVIAADQVVELRDLIREGGTVAHAAYGARGMKRPRPGAPVIVPRSNTTSPRDSTISGQPVTSQPSYGS